MMLSRLYAWGAGWDRRLTRTRRLPCPVISVGNIAFGGRSKTPWVSYVVGGLRARGFLPIVLTRGYASRRSSKVWLNDVASLSADYGDEACEIFLQHRCPVLVGSNRYQNALGFLNSGSVSNSDFKKIVFLLDDGFQHWRIDRDFDLVLVTESDWNGQGLLREQPQALDRADLVLRRDLDFSVEMDEIPHSDLPTMALTTRASSERYFEQIRKARPQAVCLALVDHAQSPEVRMALSRFVEEHGPCEILVGGKEFVKLFSGSELSARWAQGEAPWTAREGVAAGRVRLIKARVRPSDPQKIWVKLDSILQGFQLSGKKKESIS